MHVQNIKYGGSPQINDLYRIIYHILIIDGLCVIR